MKKKSEFEVAKKKKEREKRLKKLPIIIICLCAFVGIYAMRYEIAEIGIGVIIKDSFAKMFDNNGYPCETEGTATMLEGMGRRAVLLSESGFEVFNEAGNKVLGKKKFLSEPLTKVRGKKLLLFSQGGKEMALYSGDVCLYEGKTENPIYNAELGKNGFIAYSTSEFGYQSSVRVLDKSFKEVFLWVSAESIITDLSIDANADNLICFGVGFLDGELCSYGYGFELNTGEEKTKLAFPGELVIDSMYLSDGKVMVLTDKTVKVIDRSGKVASDFSFKHQKLNAYCFKENGELALSLGDFSSKRGTDFIVLDPTLKNIKNTFLFENVGFIDHHKDEYVAFSDDKFIVLDSALGFNKKGHCPDAVCVKVIGDYVYYTTENSLERIKL